MSIAEKLTAIAQNQQAVYDAGYAAGQVASGDAEAVYQQGVTDGIEQGKQAEYDRFWDAFQENGNKKTYRYAFAGGGWSEETLIPKYPINIIDTSTTTRYGQGMFYYLGAGLPDTNLFDMTEICKRVDFSKAINLQYLCFNAKAKNITVDASGAQNLSQAFQGGDGGFIDNITLTVSSACNNYNNTFIHSSGLKNLTFTSGSEIAASISLQQSSKLTRASIESVVTALSDNTSGLTATFNKTAKEAAFTTDEWNALVATKPNWTITLA